SVCVGHLGCVGQFRPRVERLPATAKLQSGEACVRTGSGRSCVLAAGSSRNAPGSNQKFSQTFQHGTGKEGFLSRSDMVSNLKDTQERAELAALLEQNREGLLTCVHCGLCLPSCPTYRVLGNENDSPRGRLYLMRGVMENRLEPGHAFTSHIDRCLGCRACETVCPSGVPYGQVLEAARAEVAAIHERRKSPTALLTRFILNQIF